MAGDGPVRLSAGDRGWALAREEALRGFCRPELTDYGAYENVLECELIKEEFEGSFVHLFLKGESPDRNIKVAITNDGRVPQISSVSVPPEATVILPRLFCPPSVSLFVLMVLVSPPS